MSENNGGPAFPQPMRPDDPDAFDDEKGMSLRDYFAAAYVAGRAGREDGIDEFAEVAARAYEIADAMLAERAKAKTR